MFCSVVLEHFRMFGMFGTFRICLEQFYLFRDIQICLETVQIVMRYSKCFRFHGSSKKMFPINIPRDIHHKRDRCKDKTRYGKNKINCSKNKEKYFQNKKESCLFFEDLNIRITTMQSKLNLDNRFAKQRFFQSEGMHSTQSKVYPLHWEPSAMLQHPLTRDE